MSAPTDFVRLQKGLENNPTARLVLFCISFYTNYKTAECWPSIATLADESNLHPSTVRRHVHELEKLGFIKLQPRERASSIITLVGYKEWIEQAPVRQPVVDTSAAPVGGTSTVPVGYSHTASRVLAQREGGTSTARAEIDNLNILSNINKKKPDEITRCYEDESRVYFENDKIKLCDQLEQFWLKEFNGQADDLALALLQIAAYVQPNNVHGLEKQVSSQLARICRDRREKDQRYKNAKNPQPAPAKTSNERGWVKITKDTEPFNKWVAYAKAQSESSIATVFQKCGYAFVPDGEPASAWEEFLKAWRCKDDERRSQQTRATSTAA